MIKQEIPSMVHSHLKSVNRACGSHLSPDAMQRVNACN